MIFDAQNTFSDQQAVTATAVSANTIDLGVPGTLPWRGGTFHNDLGRGEDVEISVTCTQTFLTCTSVQVQLVTSASADLSSPTVIDQTDAILVASLVAGYKWRLGKVPPGITQRYLGLKYVVAGSAATAGKITAGLVLDKQTTGTI